MLMGECRKKGHMFTKLYFFVFKVVMTCSKLQFMIKAQRRWKPQAITFKKQIILFSTSLLSNPSKGAPLIFQRSVLRFCGKFHTCCIQ